MAAGKPSHHHAAAMAAAVTMNKLTGFCIGEKLAKGRTGGFFRAFIAKMSHLNDYRRQR
jgi:hypothetical protein